MSDSKFDAARLKEKVEVLDGSRQSQTRKAAVRIEDLQQLLELVEVKTETLTASPTMDDFNSLLADVRTISNMLLAVGHALQGRILK